VYHCDRAVLPPIGKSCRLDRYPMHVEPIRLVEPGQLTQGSVDRVDAVDTMDRLNVDFDRVGRGSRFVQGSEDPVPFIRRKHC
jgi:hypothetical protein